MWGIKYGKIPNPQTRQHTLIFDMRLPYGRMRRMEKAPMHMSSVVLMDVLGNIKQPIRYNKHITYIFKTFNISEHCRFLKFDIKDFFMSGNHADVGAYSSEIVDEVPSI